MFDAVRLYEALGDMTAMQPVVVDPKISFSQLMQEMIGVSGEDERQLIREQFLAKLQRKKKRLSEKNAQDFETAAGMPPEAFVRKLREMSNDEIADWFVESPLLGEILDRVNPSEQPVLVSDHPDQLYSVERGYGEAEKPEDYIAGIYGVHPAPTAIASLPC